MNSSEIHVYEIILTVKLLMYGKPDQQFCAKSNCPNIHSIILWKSVIITSSTFTSVFHSGVNISTVCVWYFRCRTCIHFHTTFLINSQFSSLQIHRYHNSDFPHFLLSTDQLHKILFCIICTSS